jgi:hypothetical protein
MSVSYRLRSKVQDKDYENIKYQLKIQRVALSSKGRLNLSQPDPDLPPIRLTTLTPLGTQQRLKVLDVSKTPLAGLQTLPPQPVLEKIIANETQIGTYAGLGRHPRLKSLWLLGTPLSALPQFRLTLCILVGTHLTSINGVPVSPGERSTASEYPLLARYLIEAGWEVEVPAPSLERFIALSNEKRLRFKGVDSGFTTVEAQKYLRAPPALLVVKSRPDGECESPPEEQNPNDELIRAICVKLDAVGFHIKPDETNVLHAIERLAGILQELGTVSELPEILGLDLGPGLSYDGKSETRFEEEDAISLMA